MRFGDHFISPVSAFRTLRFRAISSTPADVVRSGPMRPTRTLKWMNSSGHRLLRLVLIVWETGLMVTMVSRAHTIYCWTWSRQSILPSNTLTVDSVWCDHIVSPPAPTAIPFDTQFFHDDADDGLDGLDGAGDAPLPSTGAGADGDVEDEELAELARQAALRRVRPEYVDYAKKAKRVDVKKLKETIWKELDIQTGLEPELEKDGQTEDEVSVVS